MRKGKKAFLPEWQWQWGLCWVSYTISIRR